VPMPGPDEERLRPLGASEYVVRHRMAGHVSTQESLNLGTDRRYRHLGVGLGQNSHDGAAHRAKLTPAVRPASARPLRPDSALVRGAARETLEKVSEGVV